MTAEAHAIAARLAAASEVFPVVKQDDWDDVAHATAENEVVTIVVTERKSRAKREYRAVVQLVAETPTAPVDLDASTSSGSRSENPITREDIHR